MNRFTADANQLSDAYGKTTIDPAALMRIQNLQLRARIVVEGLYAGLHRSPYHGYSVEFSEYREYSPGDDLKFFDWRLFARTDRYYLKRFEEETSMRCHLLVDLSRSMAFQSIGYAKVEYARTLAATLAHFLTSQRDAIGLITFDEAISDYLPARHRPGHLHRIMLSLERAPTGAATNVVASLERVAQVVRKRGLIVLISDLLLPVDWLHEPLACLRSQGHEVIILRVLDPAERDFNFTRPALFQDMETDREIYIDPAVARSQYERLFREHSKALEQLAHELAIEIESFITTEPLERVLFDFLHARSRLRRLSGTFALRRGGRRR